MITVFALLSLIFGTTTCTSDRLVFSSVLDTAIAQADDSLHRSAFPYADLAFDNNDDLFEGLATHDTGYILSGVTWMWDINPSRVLVIKARPSVEGSACVDVYTARVVAYYADPLHLPDVRRDDENISN